MSRSTRTAPPPAPGIGPQVMATIRNTIVSVLRLAGHDNIAAGLRHHSRSPLLPVDLRHVA
ncbi:hypothetical protein JO861_12490 [Rhodococcus hoagii]|nr:hypothetical protein [Prescottella equi]